MVLGSWWSRVLKTGTVVKIATVVKTGQECSRLVLWSRVVKIDTVIKIDD